MTYIRGGSPPGNPGVNHRGCRCKREPRGDVPVRLPQSLYFAGQSRGWGGGAVAFITVCAGDTPTLARAYLIQRDHI